MPGFCEGGEDRLREVLRKEVEREYFEELCAATDYWQRQAIEKKIDKEVKERMKAVSSPHSLWSSP